MKRRKFVVGLGSLAAGSAAAMGTGAFSVVQADREKTTAIRNDNNAYLAFKNPRNPYASYNNGLIEFDFSSDNGHGGQGLNDVADTRFNNLFEVENQGTNDVYVWLATDEPNSGLYQSFECIIEGTDVSEPGNSVVVSPGVSKSVDFLFHVGPGGAEPGDIFHEDLQFRARDTKQGDPAGEAGAWVREPVENDNDSDFV